MFTQHNRKSQALNMLVYYRFLKTHPDFGLVWLGQSTSRLGDVLYQIALALWVLYKTNSPGLMGLVLLFSYLPMILFLLIGGAVADRFPRLKLMAVSDLLAGLVVLVVAVLALAGLLEVWMVIIASVIFGLVGAFFEPAYSALVPELVKRPDRPKQSSPELAANQSQTEVGTFSTDAQLTPNQKGALRTANGLTNLSAQVVGVGGPLLGATIVALTGPVWIFALDGFSFLVAAGCSAWVWWHRIMPAKLVTRQTALFPTPPDPTNAMLSVDAAADYQETNLLGGRQAGSTNLLQPSFSTSTTLLMEAAPGVVPAATSTSPSPALVPALVTSGRWAFNFNFNFKQIYRDIVEGLRLVKSIRWLWISLILTALCNIALKGPFMVALPFLLGSGSSNNNSSGISDSSTTTTATTTQTALTTTDQAHPALSQVGQDLGLVQAAYCVGCLLGAFVLGHLYSRLVSKDTQTKPWVKRGPLLYYVVLAGGLGIALMGLPIALPGLMAAAALRGAEVGFFNLIWLSLVQEYVPSHALGRVSSVDYLLSWSLLPVGYGLTGLLTQWVGPQAIFMVGGLVAIGITLFALSRPSIRELV